MTAEQAMDAIRRSYEENLPYFMDGSYQVHFQEDVIGILEKYLRTIQNVSNTGEYRGKNGSS